MVSADGIKLSKLKNSGPLVEFATDRLDCSLELEIKGYEVFQVDRVAYGCEASVAVRMLFHG